LHHTLEDASAAAGGARELTTGHGEQLRRTLDSFERSAQNMERLSSRLDSLRGQVQVLVARVDHGDGTLARMVNDGRLFDDVRASVTSLNLLIDDLRKNPKKYINLHIF